MSTASEQKNARQNISSLANNGNKIVSFRGGAGLVITTGYIERADDLFGGDVSAADHRWIATLLVEDVGEIHRGDRVTDEDGGAWILVTQEPSGDDFVTDWTCERA